MASHHRSCHYYEDDQSRDIRQIYNLLHAGEQPKSEDVQPVEFPVAAGVAVLRDDPWAMSFIHQAEDNAAARSISVVQRPGSLRTRSRLIALFEGHTATLRALRRFLVVVLVLVPLFVFALSSVIAAVLWSIECTRELATPDGMCSYYQWFKHVVGILIGVKLSSVADGTR